MDASECHHSLIVTRLSQASPLQLGPIGVLFYEESGQATSLSPLSVDADPTCAEESAEEPYLSCRTLQLENRESIVRLTPGTAKADLCDANPHACLERAEIEVFVFLRPPTHFSHMSHPTFPISHLLLFLFWRWRSFGTTAMSKAMSMAVRAVM